MMPRRAACPGWASHRQASKPAEVALREELMRLAPLYRIRFTYPESWAVSLDGGWQQLFFLAEGRCEGWISGRFRGANFPRRHGAEGPFRPDFRAVIEAEDGAVIMVEWHGYGRAYPPGRRQVVGALFHLADQSPTDTPAGYLRQPMTARTANPCPVSVNLVRGAAWQPPVGRPR
jgi:hypothetical protein